MSYGTTTGLTILMGVSRLLIVAAAWFMMLARADAEGTSTSDVIHVAGGDSGIVVDRKHYSVGNEQWYIHFGLLTWAPRAGAALPVRLTVMSRGLPHVLFFEAAPFLGLFSPNTEEALRELLQVPPNQELPPDDASSLPQPVTFKRRVVRNHMRGFDLKTLADVVALNRCQQGVDLHASTSPAALEALIACSTSLAHKKGSPDALLQLLRSRGLVHPMLRVETSSADASQVIGYVIQVSAQAQTQTAEIHAAAGGAREEKIATVTVSPGKELLQTEAAKLFLPSVFTLLGIVVTAIVGFAVFQKQQRVQFEYFGKQQDAQFQGFLRQQEVQRRQAEADRFQQRKYEQFTQLRDFFSKTYPRIVEDERVSIVALRNRMMADNVYSILPAESVAKLNDICDADDDRAGAIRQIDALMRESFREFMTEVRRP